MDGFMIGLVLLAAVSVAVADALVKKIGSQNSWLNALSDPSNLFLVLALYLVQILVFIYVFTKGELLGIVGNLQMVAYSLVVLLASVFYFGETLTNVQLLGIALGVTGAVLMNSGA